MTGYYIWRLTIWSRSEVLRSLGWIGGWMLAQIGALNFDIVAPGLFEKRKQEVLGYPYLMISGILQNQEGAISVKAQGVTPLHLDAPRGRAHDFH